MNTKRCVNCGTRLGDGVGIEFNTLKHISLDLVTKLENWLKPIHVKPANRVCEPCLLILKKCPNRLANNLICLGCGDNLNVNDRVELNQLELEICRSWVSKDVAVKHLTKVCNPCMNRVKIYSTKSEPEFIEVENDIYSTDKLDSVSVKSEPECTENHDLDCESNGNVYSDCSGVEDDTDQKEPIKKENDIALNDDAADQNNFEDDSDQNNSEDECVVNEEKEDSDCIKYEYHEKESTPKTKDKGKWGWNRSKYNKNDESDEDYVPYPQKKESSVHKTHCKNQNVIEEPSTTIENKSKYNTNDDSDEDYIPYQQQKESSVRKRHCENENLIEKPSTSTEDLNSTDTITLTKYKRTYRIGCCIFNGCTNECVSLIPRTVKRKMILEHNLYILPLSRVCEEHLQDQNWEELLSDTTQNFTGYHCQDMKNIVQNACLTNLDFENIETVDSRLVRYWFDLNKSDFNRIYNSFPKLKRLKRPKTALALYLMSLQSTSLKRIALLAKMKEKTAKRYVMFVKDIVRCDNFSALRDLFLNDD